MGHWLKIAEEVENGCGPWDGQSYIVAVKTDERWLVAEASYHSDCGDDTGWWWANTGPGDYGAEKIVPTPTHFMLFPRAPGERAGGGRRKSQNDS